MTATPGSHGLTQEHRTSRLLTLSLASSLAVILYVVLTCFYNYFLHPLRRFKGPPLARVSKLWSRIGNFHGRKSHRIHEAHLKYGSVVRVGPNEISFADPVAVREIYTSDNFVKEETFYRAKRIFHENHLMSFRNPEAHKKRRKLLSKGFSQASMLEFEPKMSSKIQTMLDHWAEKSGDPIDAYSWAHWLGFDIVYHLMFDEDPGSISAGKPPSLMPYLRAWRPTFIYKEFMPWLEQWGPYVPGPVGGYFRKVQEWKDLAVEIIRQCRSRHTDTPFLRSVLQGEKDTYLGRGLTDSELAEECMGGMFGGSGTTANSFVFLLWACLQRPDIVEILKKELHEAYPDKDTVPDYNVSAHISTARSLTNSFADMPVLAVPASSHQRNPTALSHDHCNSSTSGTRGYSGGWRTNSCGSKFRKKLIDTNLTSIRRL